MRSCTGKRVILTVFLLRNVLHFEVIWHFFKNIQHIFFFSRRYNNTASTSRLLLLCNENWQVSKDVHNLKLILMDLPKFISGTASLRHAPCERSYDIDRKVTDTKGSCLEDYFFFSPSSPPPTVPQSSRDILSISWRRHRNISVIWLTITF